MHNPVTRYRPWIGLAALIGAVCVFFSLKTGTPRLALFWIFGLAFGFIIQRSRFCFVSAIGNFFLFKDARLLKGILAGLFIATIGFALIMYRQIPDPSSGIPAAAYVAPFGWHLPLAGLIFGLGMMLAGGCLVGTLYRIGEGAVGSLVALLGIVVGMGILQHNWPWWWNGYISRLPNVWLPSHVGWTASVGLTLSLILLLLALVTLGKRPKAAPERPTPTATEQPAKTRFSTLLKSVFIGGWPLASGGILLGLGNILLYQTAERPWGITGEVMRWAQDLMQAVHIPAPPVGNVPGT